MANKKNLKIDLNIKNFGPHKTLECHHKMNRINMGIFANNGSGKTFISRAFRLASPLNNIEEMDNSETDKLLTKNRNNGKFVFQTTYKKNPAKKLEINLNRGSTPKVKNDTGYLFHVFNSDYVSENLESNNYNPSGDEIEGYILGKATIDLKRENSNLQKLREDQENVNEILKEDHGKAIEELNALGISKNLKEYQKFKDFKKLMDAINVKENQIVLIKDITVEKDQSFESLKELHQKMESMPDNIEDIPSLEYMIDESALNNLETLLVTTFDKSKLHEEFVEKIRSEPEFIEKGMKLYHSNDDQKCPFCKTKLDEKAIDILDKYDQYIADEEAKAIKEIEKQIESLKKLKEDIGDHYNKFNEIKVKFNDVKPYLPSHLEENLHIKDNSSVIDKIDVLLEMLMKKKSDVTLIDFDPEEDIINIIDFLHKLKIEFQTQSGTIATLNKAKNDKKKELLTVTRRLCNAKCLEFIENEERDIKELKKLDLKIKQTKNLIEEKEKKANIDRKEEVIKSLKYFLNFFFKDKYSFDEEEFSIKFGEETLSHDAGNVLSDGEKGIVAFCYYLATVHMLIKEKGDYKKLFFVIDDPISSMDFDFVYAVAQSIRTIKNHFKIESYSRFIVLTHNFEFMNILNGNNITDKEYILKNSEIMDAKNRLLLPYESHLEDIVDVANGKEEPSHTTANSIRHVLETICGFESPNKPLHEFISEKEELCNDANIQCLINDQSHGKLRYERLNTENIKNLCDIVVEYVSNEYPEQIPEDT